MALHLFFHYTCDDITHNLVQNKLRLKNIKNEKQNRQHSKTITITKAQWRMNYNQHLITHHACFTCGLVFTWSIGTGVGVGPGLMARCYREEENRNFNTKTSNNNVLI